MPDSLVSFRPALSLFFVTLPLFSSALSAQGTRVLLNQTDYLEIGLPADLDCGNSLCGVASAAADNFSVSSPGVMTRVEIWGSYIYDNNAVPTNETFTLSLRVDDNHVPGRVVATTSDLEIERDLVETTTYGLQIYRFTLTLRQPLPLSQGVFWLEIYGDTSGESSGDFFWWHASPATDSVDSSAYAGQTPGETWQNLPDDMSLRIFKAPLHVSDQILVDQTAYLDFGLPSDLDCDSSICSSARAAAENFGVSGYEFLTKVEFWGSYIDNLGNSELPATDSFTVNIHSASGTFGLPEGIIEHVTSFDKVERSLVATSSNGFPFDVYRFTLHLERPVALERGNYFVQILGDTSSVANGDFWWWQASSVGSSVPNAAYSETAPGHAWTSLPGDMALRLTTSIGVTDVLLDQSGPLLGAVPADADCEWVDCQVGTTGADDVILTRATSVEKIEFWGAYSPADTAADTDDFTIVVSRDDQGKPGADKIILTDFEVVVRQFDQITRDPIPVEVYRFTVVPNQPIALPAGRHWFEIYADSSDETDDFVWMNALAPGATGTEGMFLAHQNPGQVWVAASVNAAIRLSGQTREIVAVDGFEEGDLGEWEISAP